MVQALPRESDWEMIIDRNSYPHHCIRVSGEKKAEAPAICDSYG